MGIIVDDLNHLATSGITVTRGSTSVVYKGVLIAFLADNLASHAVGGFKKSMSFARHFCRFCLATKEESCCMFTADQFKKRTHEEYEQMCIDIAGDTTGVFSTQYNINERSILNDVPSFSVNIGGLCHRLCIMYFSCITSYSSIMYNIMHNIIMYKYIYACSIVYSIIP